MTRARRWHLPRGNGEPPAHRATPDTWIVVQEPGAWAVAYPAGIGSTALVLTPAVRAWLREVLDDIDAAEGPRPDHAARWTATAQALGV